jgi:hypothetical protein
VRGTFTVAVNALVLFALLEISALAYYYVISSQLFYARPVRVESDVERTVNAPFASTSQWRMQLHPYFAFNYVPATKPFQDGLYYNNHGFLQSADYVKNNLGCCDYPSERGNPDEFIVGIFGGSVAAGFAVNSQGMQTFVEELKKSPALAGRQIRVLNFASGAYKQPQQLLVLAYYLSLGQPLDAVVNIDGFNELLYGAEIARSGFEISAPNSAWANMLTARETGSGGEAAFNAVAGLYYDYLRKDYVEAAERCRLGSCWLLNTLAAEYLAAKTSTLKSEKSDKAKPADRSFFLMPQIRDTGADVWNFIAERWANSSLILRDMAASRGIAYLHVLQPNRYYPDDPTYVPMDPADGYWRHTVPIAYAAAQASIPDLKRKGVAVLDSTAIFANAERGVFGTDCCHLSIAGNELLMRVVASALASAIDAQATYGQGNRERSDQGSR